MKKNKELKQKKNNKLLIITIITITILLIIFLAYYFLIYNKESNVLKRTLIDQGYKCNEKVCIKKINDDNYSFNYLTGELTTSNKEFVLKISKNENPTLEVKKQDYICIYEKDNYNPKELITNEFTYNNYCKQYIDEINEIINNRNRIYKISNINL